MPIVFVEGVAGQLFGDQALTVTFSLVISLLFIPLGYIPDSDGAGADIGDKNGFYQVLQFSHIPYPLRLQ